MTDRKKKSDWQYLPGYTRTFALPDPRVAVSRHINWDKANINNYPNHTLWHTPEPDNYTHAVWHQKPHELPDIEHQCWYRDRAGGGWMSLYIIPVAQQQIFVDYFTANQVWASWVYHKPVPMRTRISNINYDLNRSWGKNAPRTDDERFFDMGFYDNLVAKGAKADYVFKFAGVSRPPPVELPEIFEERD